MLRLGGRVFAADLLLELPDLQVQVALLDGVLGAELPLALLQSFDRVLALVGVALRDGAFEDESPHPSFVRRRLGDDRHSGLAA